MSTGHEKVISAEDALGFGGQMLAEGRAVKMRLGGYSMWPTMIPGDVATIIPIRAEDVKVGDVVVFDRGHRWIAHRLISKEDVNGISTFVSRGDSCMNKDAPFGEETLKGSVVQVQRGKGLWRLDGLKSQRFGRFMAITSDFSSPMIHAALFGWRLPQRIWRRLRRVFQ